MIVFYERIRIAHRVVISADDRTQPKHFASGFIMPRTRTAILFHSRVSEPFASDPVAA
jgi:hypothetical protein